MDTNQKLRPGSLTDIEVSIVMNLLKRDTYQNQEILSIINAVRRLDGRPDTNNGRITEVKYLVDGQSSKLSPAKLARYASLSPLSDIDADKFLEKAKSTSGAPLITNLSPIDERVLRELLPVKSINPPAFNITETDRVECKETFSWVLKTIAAFANNKGGYFVFGVKDKTWEIVGLSEKKIQVFNGYDLKTINTEIRNKLGADLQIQKRLIDVNGKKIGILYIAPAHIKPLIFVSGDGDITQGHIYYRYSGEDRLIAPQDLQKLLEDRLRQLSETVLTKHLLSIFRNGIENSAVMNVNSGEIAGKSGSFVIDESLLPKVQFIKEGEFVETAGAPALKLVGELKTGTVVHSFQKVNISEIDLIEGFLKQETPSNPEAYIRRYSESPKDWMPVYYYGALKGLSIEGILDVLNKNSACNAHKISNIKKGKKPAGLYQAKTNDKELAELKAHKKLSFSKADTCKKYLRALSCWDFSAADKPYVISFLKEVYDQFYSTCESDLKSLIRSVIAYADITIYRPACLAPQKGEVPLEKVSA